MPSSREVLCSIQVEHVSSNSENRSMAGYTLADSCGRRLLFILAELAASCDARRLDRRTYLASVATKQRVPERAHGAYLLSGGLLKCRLCGGHFEALKSPWKHGGNYVCATRRRKPGVCANTLALPIESTDKMILEMVDQAFSPALIEELFHWWTAAPSMTVHGWPLTVSGRVARSTIWCSPSRPGCQRPRSPRRFVNVNRPSRGWTWS